MTGMDREDCIPRGDEPDPGDCGEGLAGAAQDPPPAPLQLSEEEVELVFRKVVEAAASVGRALAGAGAAPLQNSTKLDW